MKNLKKLSIFSGLIILVIIVICVIFKYNPLDRLNVTSNKVKYVNQTDEDITKLNVYFIGIDTIQIIKAGKLIKDKMPDWYGKEHILCVYKDSIEKHHFNRVKFDSWRKVNYSINIDEVKGSKLLTWKLTCFGMENVGGKYFLD